MTARLSVVARPDLAPVLVAERDLRTVLPDLARHLGRHGLVTVAKTSAASSHGAADAPAGVAPPDAPVAAPAAHPAARPGPRSGPNHTRNTTPVRGPSPAGPSPEGRATP